MARDRDIPPFLKPDGFPGPAEREAVRMVSTVKKAGVLYEVYIGPWIQWSKFVLFGKRKRYQPGGSEFRRAAREQETAAKAAVDLIEVGAFLDKAAESGLRT